MGDYLCVYSVYILIGDYLCVYIVMGDYIIYVYV